MKDRSMFGSLLQYQKQTYYEAHPIMYLMTPDKNYRIDLFAARFTDSEQDNFPYNLILSRSAVHLCKRQLPTPRSSLMMHPIIRMLRSISLVTCAYSDYIQDSKFQVQGWLVQIGLDLLIA
jgi:sortase B